MRKSGPMPDARELARAFARNGPLAPDAAPPLFVVRARGSALTLADGSELLDCSSGGWLPLGHNCPEVLTTCGMSDHSVAGEGLEWPVRVELMEKLAEVAPGGTNRRVRLCDSGREALAQAIRLARAQGRGTGVEYLAAHPEPEPVFSAGTGCVVVHPFDGRAGHAARYCRASGCLLVSDETGIAPGLSGRVLASELLDQRPDIVVLGRGLAAGMPFGAVIAGSSELRWPDTGRGGSLPASTVALGYLMQVESGLLETVRERAGQLRAGLEELAREQENGRLAGAGLVLTLGFGRPIADRVAARCLAAGVLVGRAGDCAVAVRPAATAEPAELDRALKTVRAALAGAA